MRSVLVCREHEQKMNLLCKRLRCKQNSSTSKLIKLMDFKLKGCGNKIKPFNSIHVPRDICINN